MKERYFIDQDDDGHWYMISEYKEDAWNIWRNNYYSEEGYDAPEFAQAIDSPSEIKFYLED